MRVGVFLGDYAPQIGGGYTFVAGIADAFIETAGLARHEFVFFCSPAYAAILVERTLPENLKIVAIPPRSYAGWAVSALQHHSPVFRHLWRWPGRLERLARREEVAMMWFVGGGVFDTLDIPYVATIWDVQHRTHPWFPEVSSGGRWEYREAMHARFLGRATYAITGTEIGREQLGWYYRVPPDRVRVLPHPTPALRDPAGDAVNMHLLSSFEKRQFIMYPAQFWPHKNHYGLLRAAQMLRDSSGIEVDVVLTGSDKGNQEYVRGIAEDLGVAGQVHMLGFVSTAELAWLYNHALALVYPSYSGPENLPPLEAFSLGCPVLISEYPGAKEQLGEAARYFDPADPASIATAIAGLIANPAQRDDMTRQGRLRSEAWKSCDYVKGVFTLFDEFEAVRRCWA